MGASQSHFRVKGGVVYITDKSINNNFHAAVVNNLPDAMITKCEIRKCAWFFTEAFFPFQKFLFPAVKYRGEKINNLEIAQAHTYTAELLRKIIGKFRAVKLLLVCNFCSFTDKVYDLLATRWRLSWKLLQRLETNSVVKAIQNIFCSVVNNISYTWRTHAWSNVANFSSCKIINSLAPSRSMLLDPNFSRFHPPQCRWFAIHSQACSQNIRLAALPATLLFHSQ